MKTLNVLYNSIDDLISNNKIDDFYDDENCLVRIYVSSDSKAFAKDSALIIKNKLPKAKIIGICVDGVLFDGDIHKTSHLISIISLKKAEVFTKLVSCKDFEKNQIAKEISKEVNKFSPSSVFLFLGSKNEEIYKITQYLSKNSKEVTFTGGVAGYLDKKTDKVTSFVFDDKEIIEEGFVLAGISKEYVLSYTNTVVGHEAVSDVHTITKCDGVFIDEIDNLNAIDWIKEKIGIDNIYKSMSESLENNILIRLPFVLEGEDGSSRILNFDLDKQKLTPHYTLLNDNQEFRVGYLSPLKSIEEWQSICIDLQKSSAEYIFAHSCMYRRIYLENLSKKELMAFKEANICGAFLRGEIGTKNGKTRYYNGACTLITLAEERKFININLEAFNDVVKLNDNIKLIEDLKEVSSDSNPIINNLIFDELNSEDFNYKDSAKTMLDYIKNTQKNEYSKICVVTNEVLNIDFTPITSLKQREYSSVFLENAKEFFKNNYPDTDIKFYRYNKSSFFFMINEVKSEVRVIEMTQKLYTHLNKLSAKYSEVKVFNKLTISLGLKRIQKLLLSQPNLRESGYKNSFNIFSDKDETMSLQKEFDIVSELKEIVENETVMPYVQGIYDNINGGFFAHEVIMRLISPSGEVLFPETFLEISKKYDIYLDLSYILVRKVLDFVKDSEKIVLINISIKDIESEEFSNMVFSKLSKMKNPQNIIFEVCDLSLCNDIEKLKLFVFKLSKLKMKFAVDNFEIKDYQILNNSDIKVDFIKITSAYLNDEDANLNQEENIFSISKKLSAELMVKHVETAAMQKQVLSHSIKYTQGFFFSRPVYIDDNNAMSENNNEDINNNENETHKIEYKNLKAKEKVFIYSGIFILIILSVISTIIFTTRNMNLVTQMNDVFLEELATGLSIQISDHMENAKENLALTSVAVLNNASSEEEILDNLAIVSGITNFDDIYISFDSKTPINSEGEELDIDVDSIYNDNGFLVSSPLKDSVTGREFFVMGMPVFLENEKVIEVFGVYYLENFSSILNLKIFDGEAFFHICEVDGTPVVLSGNDDNLFLDGDMYSFISSLDITNGHTISSIKEDMENSESVLLKYSANNQERTAVMLRIEGTDWCIVSIVLDDVIEIMQNTINSNTLNFVVFVLIIFILYVLAIFEIEKRNKKQLLKALESSNLLANSLQVNIEMDSLTRTYSRSAAEEKISSIINKKQEKEKNAFVLLDVDNFKSVNDTYGHKTGDIFLQELTIAVKNSLRSGDIIGRIGGDEFVILLNNIVDIDVTKSILTRILSSVNTIEIKGVSLNEVSISAGVAIVPEEGIDYDKISTKADKALYLAKLAGKNNFMIYDEL